MKLAHFDAAAEEGLVNRKDDGHLSLYNYTPLCVYKRTWTPITLAARGIVFDRRTGRVVARPFDKFFNLGEPDALPEALPTSKFTVDEKLDGSLGIVFHDGERWRCTTRGSFESSQAQWGQEQLNKLSASALRLAEGHTLLFELIYPGNRIVVDYDGREEMVLLGARLSQTGDECPVSMADWWANQLCVRRPERFEHKNILDLPHADDLSTEGYVIRFGCDTRVKVKSPKYVRVHRLLEYCSPRRVLEMLENDSYDEMRAELPEEIAGEFDDIAASLQLSMRQIAQEVSDVWEELVPLVNDRKAFALAAMKTASPRALPVLFAYLDGKPTKPLIVKAVRKGLAEEIRS